MTLYSFIKPGETKPAQRTYADRKDAVYMTGRLAGLPLRFNHNLTTSEFEAIENSTAAVGYVVVPVEILEVGK